MALAASLWFDHSFEAQVRELWAGLAREGITDGLHAGLYRPHVTLGVWDGMALALFVAALKRVADDTSAFELVFDSVGAFEDDASVVFLRPQAAPSLLSLHARVHALAAAQRAVAQPNHLVGAWNPHCTLAWRLTSVTLARTLAFLRTTQLPGPCRVVAIGVIDTPAETELERIELLDRP